MTQGIDDHIQCAAGRRFAIDVLDAHSQKVVSVRAAGGAGEEAQLQKLARSTVLTI